MTTQQQIVVLINVQHNHSFILTLMYINVFHHVNHHNGSLIIKHKDVYHNVLKIGNFMVKEIIIHVLDYVLMVILLILLIIVNVINNVHLDNLLIILHQNVLIIVFKLDNFIIKIFRQELVYVYYNVHLIVMDIILINNVCIKIH